MKTALIALVLFVLSYVGARFLVPPPAHEDVQRKAPLATSPSASDGMEEGLVSRSGSPRVAVGLSALAAASAANERIPEPGALSFLQTKMLSPDEPREQREAAGAVFRNLKIAIQKQIWDCWPGYLEPAVRLQIGVLVHAANGTMTLQTPRIEGVVNGPLGPEPLACIKRKLAELPRLDGPRAPLAALGAFRTGVVVEVESPCSSCIQKPEAL